MYMYIYMYVYIDIYLYMHVYVSEIWSAVSAAQSASCSPRNDTPCHLQASRQLLYNYRKRKCFYYVLIQTEDVRLYSRTLFLASLRFCVHYCIDRDAMQEKKSALRAVF